MSESSMRKQFLDVFLKEWELRVGDEGAALAVERNHGNGDFDAPLNAGDLRLFAQVDNELVGLLYKRLDDGWIVIPTSGFTVPATEQEILIGKRVYQLWNSFTASNEFAGQSWLVDTIPGSDMKDLCEALLHVMVGDPMRADLNECLGLPITSIDDPRLEYERAFAMGRYSLPAEVFERFEHKEDIRQSRNLFDLPEDFWRKTVDEFVPYRLAAATDGDTSFMLLLKGTASEENVRKSCVECELMNDFRSINPDDDSYTLIFRPKELPPEWASVGCVPVQARNRETLEVVGDGTFTADSCEILVKTRSDIKASVDKPDQLVLAMARVED